MGSKNVFLTLGQKTENHEKRCKRGPLGVKNDFKQLVQGGVYFDEEFDGAIYLDVTAEIKELLAIFKFWVSSEVSENGQKSRPDP